MHRNMTSYSIGAAVVVLALAACSGDASTGPELTVPDAEIIQTIAGDAGDAVATSLELMESDDSAVGASGSRIVPPVGVHLAQQGGSASVTCSGPDASGWFTCDRTTWRGLDVTRQVRFWEGDAFGLHWDPAATDSVNHRRTVTGSYVPARNPARTVWVNRADTVTMTVARTGDPVQHVWTGVGVRSDSSAYAILDAMRVFHYTAYDTASAVTFNLPRSQYPWPQSGTVVHDVTTLVTANSGRRSFSRTVTRRVAVTFNGTQHVPLTVGDLTCDLDLETHEVTDCG